MDDLEKRVTRMDYLEKAITAIHGAIREADPERRMVLLEIALLSASIARDAFMELEQKIKKLQ